VVRFDDDVAAETLVFAKLLDASAVLMRLKTLDARQ
jgi:hypothetical protein